MSLAIQAQAQLPELLPSALPRVQGSSATSCEHCALLCKRFLILPAPWAPGSLVRSFLMSWHHVCPHNRDPGSPPPSQPQSLWGANEACATFTEAASHQEGSHSVIKIMLSARVLQNGRVSQQKSRGVPKHMKGGMWTEDHRVSGQGLGKPWKQERVYETETREP